MELANKTAFITGGASGLGLATARNFVAAGANVFLYDLNAEALAASASEFGDNAKWQAGDVADEAAVKSAVASAIDHFGTIHINVNSAGIGGAARTVGKNGPMPLEKFEYIVRVNLIGTLNLLECCRKIKTVKSIILATSDKCYENLEWLWGYRENDRLGGHDPYSASKASAEMVFSAYARSYFIERPSLGAASARAGNVIGGGDWAQNRIVVDCVEAWSKGQIVEIRSPNATRPWQHVLEPLSGYLTLAANLTNDRFNHGKAYNFGPTSNQNYPVSELIDEMSKYWKQVKWSDVSKKEAHPHEAELLKLNCDKSLALLNWNAVMGFEDTVRMTAKWYSDFYKNPATISNTTNSQLEEYISLALLGGLDWAR